MTSLPFSFLAASCASMSNLFFRKNTDHYADTYNPSGYLVCFYLFSLISSLLINPLIWEAPVNYVAVGLGSCVGFLNVFLMFLTFKALKRGPAGLTFAFQNASAIFPGVLLFMLFGAEFGFSCSLLQALGIVCVLTGLFLGARGESNDSSTSMKTWLCYALGCFVVQTAALTLIQGRSVLFDASRLDVFTLQEADDVWFMFGQFGTSFVLQLVLFLCEKKKFGRVEVRYGFLGGFVSFISTYFLLLATKYALPFEQAILFPCFAVSTILLCNLWANRIYKEKFNFVSNAVNSCGVFIGALR